MNLFRKNFRVTLPAAPNIATVENGTLLFGPFCLEIKTDKFRRDGVALQIGHRGSVLLQALAEANGRTVAKSELMERVWPEQILEEGNLTVQIAALRKVMGTDGDGRDWIIIVPREGYRLVASEQASQLEPAVATLPLLIVLPYKNLSDDASQGCFSDGVVEDIITALSCLKSFTVIARNSSFAYKGRDILISGSDCRNCCNNSRA